MEIQKLLLYMTTQTSGYFSDFRVFPSEILGSSSGFQSHTLLPLSEICNFTPGLKKTLVSSCFSHVALLHSASLFGVAPRTALPPTLRTASPPAPWTPPTSRSTATLPSTTSATSCTTAISTRSRASLNAPTRTGE